MSRTAVIDVSDLARGRTRAVEVGGLKLLVCNVEGRYYAIENRCPHADVPLTFGRLSGFLLQCPMHGGVIDVRNGAPRTPPIRRPAATYPARAVPAGLEIVLGD